MVESLHSQVKNTTWSQRIEDESFKEIPPWEVRKLCRLCGAQSSLQIFSQLKEHNFFWKHCVAFRLSVDARKHGRNSANYVQQLDKQQAQQ